MAREKAASKKKARTTGAAMAKKTSSPKSTAKTKAKAEVKTKVKSAASKKKSTGSTSTAKVPRKKAAAAAPAAATRNSSPKPRLSTKGKMVKKEFLIDLANHIREAIVGSVRECKGREVVGTATSGDATFELDRLAEKALLGFLKSARAPIAYYSEDTGYATFSSGQPQNLLVVDPIDGTRAAKSGFESCVISIASTRVIERPQMKDVDNAVVMEIVGDRTFYAERGKGARIYQDGHNRRHRLSDNNNLETISWSMTVPARPAELIFPTAARLIDLSSLKGGFFACNSTAFSITRLLTGQLDACVDFANRYYRDMPDEVEDLFINAGRGTVLGIAPYDMCAALLIAEEAGCVVTDAYGQGFADVLLLDSSSVNQQSIIAASNKELHSTLMRFFNVRIPQFEELLKRKAGMK